MKNFEHVDATSVSDAIRFLGADKNSIAIGGGTDLLTQVKLGILNPDRLVNLKTVPGLDLITSDKSGVNIGALATLDNIYNDESLRQNYPSLTKAIEVIASPQLRNCGTIAGNLAQGSRCWYYRGQFDCWLKHGAVCYAQDGENSRHAIFGGGPCYMVHPSDLAPVLVALKANVTIAGVNGTRSMPVEELFRIPNEQNRQLTVIAPGEIITGVHIPMPDSGSRGIYLKAMERKVWSFALASVAVQLVFDSDIVRAARIVLGGVAPKPWRLPETEAIVLNHNLSPAIISQAAQSSIAKAQPLNHNRYKIALVRGIITEALTEISKA